VARLTLQGAKVPTRQGSGAELVRDRSVVCMIGAQLANWPSTAVEGQLQVPRSAAGHQIKRHSYWPERDHDGGQAMVRPPLLHECSREPSARSAALGMRTVLGPPCAA
jgi:hypothetical protein